MRLTIFVYFLSCFLAFIGGHIMNYTAIMYAQEIFGSDLLAGIGFGLCFGPPIILGWIAGVYSDRLPPSHIVIVSQMVFVLAGGLFWTLHSLGGDRSLQISLYISATFLVGVGWSFLAPSRLAALAQIVPAHALHQASVIFNLLIMIGFGIAPILLALCKTQYGWDGVFVTISSLFLVATLLLLRIDTRATTDKALSVLAQAKEGLAAAMATPLLWQLLICSMLIYMLMGPMQVLLPRFATSVLGYGEIDRGLFLGVLAVSLILGGILCMLFSKRLPFGVMILLCINLGALAILAISQSTTIIQAGSALMVAGMAGGFGVSLIVAGLQHHAPDNIRGRILSIYTITSQVIPAFSGLMAGVMSEYLGVTTALKICAILIIAFGITGALKLHAVRAYKTS